MNMFFFLTKTEDAREHHRMIILFVVLFNTVTKCCNITGIHLWSLEMHWLTSPYLICWI